MRCPTLEELPPPPAGRTGWPWTTGSPDEPRHPSDEPPWPRVSIVTPSYNQGRYIEETIRSVLLQGYADLEYFILDGGSTDETLSVIRRYEPWLSYWASEPDRGQSHAINKGWERATGDILAYINTDDCYLPGAVAAAAGGFRGHPDAAMVYGTAWIVDESGRPLGTWEARPFDLTAMLTGGSIVPQPATFFSAPAVRGLGYLNERRHMIMDYELCTRIGTSFPTIALAQILARFRTHPLSKTRLHYETTANELLDFLSDWRPDTLSDAEWRRVRQATLSRIHYEWAKDCVLRGVRGSEVLRQLGRSLRLDPRFALARPMLTGHLVKRALLDRLGRARAAQ